MREVRSNSPPSPIRSLPPTALIDAWHGCCGPSRQHDFDSHRGLAMGRTPLVTFSHLRWNFVHQRPQHVMSRLARWRPVLFVEEPLSISGEPSLEVTCVAPNLHVARATLPEGGGA